MEQAQQQQPKTTTLQGIQTIPPTDVMYNPGHGQSAQPLSNQQMMFFSTKSDAEAIFKIAQQVDQQIQLTGGSPEKVTYTVQPQGIIANGPEIFLGTTAAGGPYMYLNATGPRPYRLTNPTKGIDQSVSDLVATNKGQTALTLTSQGFKWYPES